MNQAQYWKGDPTGRLTMQPCSTTNSRRSAYCLVYLTYVYYQCPYRNPNNWKYERLFHGLRGFFAVLWDLRLSVHCLIVRMTNSPCSLWCHKKKFSNCRRRGINFIKKRWAATDPRLEPLVRGTIGGGHLCSNCRVTVWIALVFFSYAFSTFHSLPIHGILIDLSCLF